MIKSFSYEEVEKIIKTYSSKGQEYICGIDEVGRGCVAGPLVVCAVVAKSSTFIEGVKDSKKLSSTQREKLFSKIINTIEDVGFGIVPNDFIDKFGMSNSIRLAILIALSNLKFIPNLIITDYINIRTKEFEFFLKNFFKNEKLINTLEKLSLYSFNNSEVKYIPLPKADDRIQIVSMSSILAKVTRDRLMKHLSKKYPQYLWDKNKGYLTEEHLKSIIQNGISPIHRKSFLKFMEVK
jgi:ribonuclease HII